MARKIHFDAEKIDFCLISAFLGHRHAKLGQTKKAWAPFDSSRQAASIGHIWSVA
jgi:hypothetical protein